MEVQGVRESSVLWEDVHRCETLTSGDTNLLKEKNFQLEINDLPASSKVLRRRANNFITVVVVSWKTAGSREILSYKIPLAAVFLRRFSGHCSGFC